MHRIDVFSIIFWDFVSGTKKEWFCNGLYAQPAHCAFTDREETAPLCVRNTPGVGGMNNPGSVFNGSGPARQVWDNISKISLIRYA